MGDSGQSYVRVERPDPIVRADSVAHVAFERRDVEAMSRFLVDFGLIAHETRDGVRYFRGYADQPYCVAISPSKVDRLERIAFEARSSSDLDRLATATGTKIEPAPGPGGGTRVRLTDPDGLSIDLVHGAQRAAALPTRREPIPLNTPGNKRRVNQTVRPPLEPSPVFRLGHVVLQRPDFDRSMQWYMRHFGLIPTDVFALPDGRPNLAFMRLDRGSVPADHHSLAILGGPATNLLHVSFETFDIDSLGQGQQFLRAAGWKQHWGIGRHQYGSQLFDYWKDPAGDEWEHYADGDVMNVDYPTGYHPLDRGGLWTWGDDLPDALRPKFSLRLLWSMLALGRQGKIDMSRMAGVKKALSVPPRRWMK
jgi:catechol 2,3-dioxygenase-like lactoylglutathione lyase family enzyme